MTSSTPARTAAANGARRASSAGLGVVIQTWSRSVFAPAVPSPGKCFAVAATPCRCRPPTNAAPSAAFRFGSLPNARVPRKLPAVGGVSTTGARSTSMPSRCRNDPVAAPSVPASRAFRICAGESCGGPSGRRRTGPPSWSTATRSGGLPPEAAAAWSRETSDRTAASLVMLPPKRITPPTSPRRTRPSSSALGWVPANPVMIVCPTNRAVVGGPAPAAGTKTAATAVTASARASARLHSDMHLAAHEHAGDVEVVVEHDDVGGEADAEPADLVVAERPAGHGRSGRDRVLERDAERVEVAERVDHRQDATREHAFGTADGAVVHLDVEAAERRVRALAASGGGDRVGDEREAAGGCVPGDERRLPGEVHAVEDDLHDHV